MLLGTEFPTGGEGVPPPAGLPPIVGGTRRAFLVVLPPIPLRDHWSFYVLWDRVLGTRGRVCLARVRAAPAVT